ncbi:efflux RND transporter periplasmic adaptor subunit [Longimicrobium sp.]|uniref:efflux RND transporter periplasmic adaptor subunit n=1 Tax=Longimicrobium sp. TaxID=2029185 RepID=UPI002E3389BE|nr:HlyD family efflux transporter periplasmic adaptor subunit [Longimicrobium sp.]HEX6040340.1 HlyD family efflux transporter periplasmic adaptor subunit [Longimicrobium sp.]
MDVPRTDTRARRNRRFAMIGGGIGVLGVLAFGASRLEPAAPSVQREQVIIDSVRRGEMVRAVRGPGTLVPERVRWISATTGGRVERILVQPGDPVQPGTVLLELSNPDVQLEGLDAERQMAQAQAELANLETSLQTQRLALQGTLATLRSEEREARRRAEADREMMERGLIARLEAERSADRAREMAQRVASEEEQVRVLDRSVASRLAVQRAQVERLRSITAFHGQRAGSMRVVAGAAGIVQDLQLQVGQWVTPGTTLARVVEPGRLKAVLRIPETQARDLAVGQAASIDTRSGIAAGRVVRIDPSVQAGAVTVDVALDGTLPRGARPDLTVDGTIELDRLPSVLHMGRPAYAQSEGNASLWKVVEGGAAAVRVPVRLGRASVNTVEVVSGLAAGDQVILTDLSRWENVDRLRIKD